MESKAIADTLNLKDQCVFDFFLHFCKNQDNDLEVLISAWGTEIV